MCRIELHPTSDKQQYAIYYRFILQYDAIELAGSLECSIFKEQLHIHQLTHYPPRYYQAYTTRTTTRSLLNFLLRYIRASRAISVVNTTRRPWTKYRDDDRH